MQKKPLIIIVTGGSDSLFAKKNANPFDKVVSTGLELQTYFQLRRHTKSVQSTYHRDTKNHEFVQKAKKKFFIKSDINS
jgi:hypothetical protein